MQTPPVRTSYPAPSPYVGHRLTWWWTVARRRMGVPCVVDRNTDYRSTTFLAGTARSGTTWVSELINHDNDYRYIFEPFDARKIPQVAPLGGRKYVRTADDTPDLRAVAEYVLSGRIRHRWTERFNRRLMADRRLIKDVRANLFLPWLRRQFPGLRIVLVVRDPYATASSYEKQGWVGAIEPLLAQPSLVTDFLAPHRDAMADAEDAFERAVFIWCIETLVPLSQLGSGEVHLVFYEHLVRDTESELKRLFAFLGRPYPPSVLASAGRPSLTARRDSRVVAGGPALDADRDSDRVERRRERVREITRLFGVDRLYPEPGRPDPAAVAALRRERAQ